MTGLLLLMIGEEAAIRSKSILELQINGGSPLLPLLITPQAVIPNEVRNLLIINTLIKFVYKEYC